MGACASKPKEIDNAPCEAPTTPKSNHKNNNINRAPLVDHSKPKNKTVGAEPEPKTEKKFKVAVVDDAEPAFAGPAKAETGNKFIEEANADQNVEEIGKKVELTNYEKAAIDAKPAFARQAVEKKVETTEPGPNTEKTFEVTVVADAEPAFARPAKAETENKFIEEANPDQNVREIGKKVEGKVENVKESDKKIELTNDQKAAIDADPAFARQAVEKKVETTEPEPKTEKKFEVAVVDDAKPAFARPAKAETENKFIKEANADQNVKGIGKKVEGKLENFKESEKKIELTNYQKASIDAKPAFARQAVEKKVETTEKTEKKFEVAVVDDAEPAFAKPSKAQTENKFIEEANADQNVKKIGNKVKGNVDNVKESEKKIKLITNYQKAAIDAEPAFAGQEVGEKVQKKDKGVGEKAKEIEKVEGLAEKAKESAKTVDKKVEAKATAKEIEKKVEAASIPSKAKEIEKVESLAEKAKASAKTVEKKVEAKATAKEIENKVEAAAIPSKAKESEKNIEEKVEAKAIAKEMEKVEAKAIAKEMEKVEAPIVGKFDKIDEAPQKSEKLDQK
ncbi:enolase-phosphatase E1-like [Pistacia vera]|uniref:enolase-phosphatase E1-like n=1 Tax=Pistacia vera TaxID=55513 RepID=UPI001262DD87|nr:enolase-phosphatase E1-like [Pistacia vera]